MFEFGAPTQVQFALANMPRGYTVVTMKTWIIALILAVSGLAHGQSFVGDYPGQTLRGYYLARGQVANVSSPKVQQEIAAEKARVAYYNPAKQQQTQVEAYTYNTPRPAYVESQRSSTSGYSTGTSSSHYTGSQYAAPTQPTSRSYSTASPGTTYRVTPVSPRVTYSGSRYYDYNYRPPVGDHYVQPHYRSDGTYVPGHYRTNADDSFWNNYSSWGNVNPYTYRVGNVVPPVTTYRPSSSYSFGGGSYVRGYTRKDGTYVQGHYRKR